MLVEALDPAVQADVRLGLLMPRAAVAVSQLPRGNQQAASAVVVRRGLTFRQTEALNQILEAWIVAQRIHKRISLDPLQKPVGSFIQETAPRQYDSSSLRKTLLTSP